MCGKPVVGCWQDKEWYHLSDKPEDFKLEQWGCTYDDTDGWGSALCAYHLRLSPEILSLAEARGWVW